MTAMKNYVLRQIEQGKKVKGLTGFVKIQPSAECGGKSEGKCFIPVSIVDMKTEDCGKLKIVVTPTVQTYQVGTEEAVKFTLPPSAFYCNIEEIEEIAKRRKAYSDYNSAVSVLANNRYTMVSVRRNALIDLYNRSTEAAKAIVDTELAEKQTTLKKVGGEWFKEFGQILAKAIYLPNEKDDEVDTGEEWDDE